MNLYRLSVTFYNPMAFEDLVQLVETLRDKCPWDRAQTLRSLKNKIIEEAYELVEAIELNDLPATIEEIGDIIFLALFLARILTEAGKTNLNQLIESTVRKYRRKHPHVFEKRELKDEHAVLQFWHKSKKDVFAGVPNILPALLAARIIQERASKLGFDWTSHAGPLEKVREEVRELEGCSNSRRGEELGDLLFACVNLARHLEVDAEEALRNANKKFIRRFRAIVKELQKQGKDVEHVGLEEMDKIWDEIKNRE